MDFDDIDVRMLDNLQKHGRMTNVELARKVGISPPPCLRRLRIMEKKGLLSGYHAIVDPEQTGFTVSAFCVVSLVSQASKTVDSFLQIVEKECNIRSCFSTSGNKSFVLTIVAKNLLEYEKILKCTLQDSGIVSSIESYIALNKHKDEFGLPVETLLNS